MRYDVLADDTIANGRLFVAHGVDGMKTDERGNLYTTSGGTPGVVQITSPAGTPLGRSTCRSRRRAASACLRDERRVRRRGLPGAVHHRVHARVQDSPEGRGIKKAIVASALSGSPPSPSSAGLH